ncbi:hypothetical protein LXA43DRAFT_59437 [Ganoderma leucocontextum]|nr:hypothetical protein LXA43DRAFT_59437 [Ganoderma leucocontextum]
MQLIFPSGFAYAVIKMDPLAMVKDLGLDDLDTLAAAAAMKPKKYLVYLEYPLDLPSPKSRWCRYSMSPISSTLRAEDRKNRLLPDMVVPIFPNTQCSSEIKSPVRPTPSFPSSNCFHWMENVTNVRVRRSPSGELFDNARAVSLDAEQHVALQNAFSDEYDRVDGLLSDDSDDSASSASASTSSRAESFPSIPPDALLDPKVLQACSPLDPSSYPLPPSDYTSSTGDTQASIPPQSDNSSRRRVHRPGTPSETDSGSSGSSSEADLKENTSSTAEELYALNLFGWDPDPTVPLIPLVDLWLELEEHVCAEDIPSPVDWYKEEEEIVS